MANSNNVQNVKFLRNGVVFVPGNDKTARQVALDAMESQKANLVDGTAILGRYQETNGIVKTLVGFAYISGDTKTLTVFDVDGAGADVDAKILAAIQALDAEKTSTDGKNVQVKVTEVDGKITAVNITTDNTVNSDDVDTAITNAINDLDAPDSAVPGQYVSQVSQADGKIAVTRVALPSVNAISEAGKPITAVSESLGTISATAGTINAEFVSIADSGSLITATTVEGALAEIATEIDAMDKTASAEDGKVVTTVSENDGVVSETKTNVKDLQLGGYIKDSSATGDIASTDTINAALSKLENKAAAITIANADKSINVTTAASGTDINVNIKSGEKVIVKTGDAGIYTDLDLIKITTGLPETVKERYQLLATDDSQIGANIDIPKDSHIVSITYISDTGDTHYQNLEYVYVDVSGETQTTYVDMSELVLEAEFESGVTATNGVVHGVVDQNSEGFLTVGEGGFKLAGVQNAINAKVEALDVTGDIAVPGQYVAAIEETDGIVAVKTRANVSEAVLNNYSKGTDNGAVVSTDTINAAIGKLENQVDVAKSAATTVVAEGTDAGNNMSIVETAGADGHKIFTINLTDVASAQGLTNEITARKAVDGQNGNTYAANANANYISNATSLNDADVKLDGALKTADDAMLTGVAAGYGITVSSKENKSQTISAKVNNDGGIVNDASGLHLGTIDCGTY